MRDLNNMDDRLPKAVNFYNRQWPKELISGVMFFEGLKITRQEFVSYCKKGY